MTNDIDTAAQDFIRVVFEQATRVCVECGRKFDMFDEEDAEEWHYGHDCEES
jgi:hypothetical protein